MGFNATRGTTRPGAYIWTGAPCLPPPGADLCFALEAKRAREPGWGIKGKEAGKRGQTGAGERETEDWSAGLKRVRGHLPSGEPADILTWKRREKTLVT